MIPWTVVSKSVRRIDAESYQLVLVVARGGRTAEAVVSGQTYSEAKAGDTVMMGDEAMSADDVAGMITQECDSLRDMLLEKNRNYGNSALDPVRCFSKANTVEQILVRLDDKLSRLMRGSAAGEDVERDIAGYLILLRVARRLTAKEQ